MAKREKDVARVGLVCGSRSDFPVMEKAVELLKAREEKMREQGKDPRAPKP